MKPGIERTFDEATALSSKNRRRLESTDVSSWKTFYKSLGGVTTSGGQSIVLTDSEEIVLAGFTRSYSDGISIDSLLVTQLDVDLNVVWAKKFTGSSVGVESIEKSKDDGYIVVGYTEQSDQETKDALAVKLDANGNIEWARSMGGDDNDVVTCVFQDFAGNYIISGYTESFGSSKDILVVKLDVDGNLVWLQALGNSGDVEIHTMQSLGDGSFILAGSVETSDTDALLVMMQDNGVVKWSRAWYFDEDSHINGIDLTVNGDLLLTGYTSSTSNEEDITESDAVQKPFLAKFTTVDEDLEWCTVVDIFQSSSGSSLRPNAYGQSIHATFGGGGLMFGNCETEDVFSADVLTVAFDGWGSPTVMNVMGSSVSDRVEDIAVVDGDYFVAVGTTSLDVLVMKESLTVADTIDYDCGDDWSKQSDSTNSFGWLLRSSACSTRMVNLVNLALTLRNTTDVSLMPISISGDDHSFSSSDLMQCTGSIGGNSYFYILFS